MSYRPVGLLGFSGGPASAPATKPAGPMLIARFPWGRTAPAGGAMFVGNPWPIAIDAAWDVTGKVDPVKGQSTEIRPSGANYQGLKMTESDHSSFSVDQDLNDYRFVKYKSCDNAMVRGMSDARYASLAGPAALLFFKEDRMRRLLDTLALPQYGFASGIAALAYDASLLERVEPAPGFVEATVAARDAFHKRFPRNRWTRVKEAFRVDCEDNYSMPDAWRDPKNAVATEVGKLVLAAPAVAEGGSIISHVWGDYARRIPVWLAVKKSGRFVFPTIWFGNFLSAVLGRPWNAKSSAKK